jgi:hypothetical protein
MRKNAFIRFVLEIPTWEKWIHIMEHRPEKKQQLIGLKIKSEWNQIGQHRHKMEPIWTHISA